MWKWITGGALVVLLLAGIGYRAMTGDSEPRPAAADSDSAAPPSDPAEDPSPRPGPAPHSGSAPSPRGYTCSDITVRWDDGDSGCIIAATVLGSSWSHKTIEDIQEQLDGIGNQRAMKAYNAKVEAAARRFAWDNHSARLQNRDELFGDKKENIDEMSPSALGEFLHRNAELIDAGTSRGIGGKKKTAARSTASFAPPPRIGGPASALPPPSACPAPQSGTFTVP